MHDVCVWFDLKFFSQNHKNLGRHRFSKHYLLATVNTKNRKTEFIIKNL